MVCQRLVRSIAVVVVCLVLLAAGRPILRGMGAYLITIDPLEKADAIVVLAGAVPERILEAADLYRKGYAPMIVLSTEERQSASAYRRLNALGIVIPEDHDRERMIAEQQGVPPGAIVVLDSRANSTWNEAGALMPFLMQRNIRSIIAVTSKGHTTRVGKIFRRAARGRLRVIVRPSQYDDFNPDAWWQTRWQARVVLYEYQKLLDYLWTAGTKD